MRIHLRQTQPKIVIYNNTKYYYHPNYINYGVSVHGKIINLRSSDKETGIGTLHKYGRYYFQAVKVFQSGEERYYPNRKFYYNHRFVYEAISQKLLSSNEIIKHIDGNFLNSFDNLQLVKKPVFTGKETVWHEKQFICPHCQKEMRNASKSRHSKSCIPKTLNKRESVDLTEDEKQLIDKKYNAMMKKIQQKQIPYYTKLQQHFE